MLAACAGSSVQSSAGARPPSEAGTEVLNTISAFSSPRPLQACFRLIPVFGVGFSLSFVILVIYLSWSLCDFFQIFIVSTQELWEKEGQESGDLAYKSNTEQSIQLNASFGAM